ncbi:MAG: peptidoglycan-binding protein [Alphaproteobacteria bacterium]|nr:peptidoglycan-binding protein [Alphaproteobacteria bacterium]
MSAVPEWSRRWLIWQWTSAGSIAGVSGRHVDLDRLSCPIDVFKTWHATGTLPPAAAPALAAARPVAIDRTLSLHSTGDDVLALQQRLQALQFAVEADGVFGPKTQDAVAEFQVSHGLQADGIVGPVTRATLGAA